MLESQISLFAKGANRPLRALVETRQALAPVIAATSGAEFESLTCASGGAAIALR
jgi:hypothetical protein